VIEDITVTNPGWQVSELMENYAHFSAFVHATALSVSVSIDDADDTRELLAADVVFSSGLAAALACTMFTAFSDSRGPDLQALLRRFKELMGSERH
jgi:hypothetical protein